MSSTFLTAEWRKLAIANYIVDPAILQPYLPYKTEPDLWNDNCYVSLIGFMFMDTKLKGIGIPFHRNFEEINLRFYVKHKEGDTWKRGVVFIKEIVPKPALSFVANTLYKEKYVTLPTRHTWATGADALRVSYAWRHHKAWDSILIEAGPVAQPMAPGSEEEFITEHYWGYTRVNDHLTIEYPVQHPRWNVYPVKDHEIAIRFGELYGDNFAFLDRSAPYSVMLAEGSVVSVGSMRKIR